MPTTLRTETEAGVRSIVLCRPKEYNTITPALRDELSRAIDEADRDPEVRVMLLRADGPAFCAGYGLDWSTRPEPGRAERQWDSGRPSPPPGGGECAGPCGAASGCRSVGLEDLSDPVPVRAQSGGLPLGGLALGRHGRGQGQAHRAAVHAVPPGQGADGEALQAVVTAYRLEQLHPRQAPSSLRMPWL